MEQPSQPKFMTADDWDAAYRAGTPPWDAGRPHAELIRVLDHYRLQPETVLEIGCGSGADTIVLARRRFQVTAIDCSPLAIERARLRAEQQNALCHFVLADIFEFARSAAQFDLVYECGVYHALRQRNLQRYLDVLWRVTRPGSYYFCLACAPDPTANEGRPQVTEEEIRGELGRLFEFVHLLPISLENAMSQQGIPGWSCLMVRPQV